jgi:predicted component of type VI protein secretion system
MVARLICQDDGNEILLDRAMVIVGRHPNCDARLDSPRISRRHCCMTQDHGEILVRDLGSTNGIRINGQRVETGWLRPGDELSIAHLKFRFECDEGHDATVANGTVNGAQGFPPKRNSSSANGNSGSHLNYPPSSATAPSPSRPAPPVPAPAAGENPLAEAVRNLLPPGMAEKCRIQVIVQVPNGEGEASPGSPEKHSSSSSLDNNSPPAPAPAPSP